MFTYFYNIFSKIFYFTVLILIISKFGYLKLSSDIILYLKQFIYWVWFPGFIYNWTKNVYIYYLWLKWAKYHLEFITIEIKLPYDIPKTAQAMEGFFSNVWQMHHGHDGCENWKEMWIEGRVKRRFSCEIVCIDGIVHFYLRMPKDLKELFISSLYSQFSEIEISEVDDYVNLVPQNIPNKEWDLFGYDYSLKKGSYYPIKTYPSFEIEKKVEEKTRVDPVASFIETLSQLKKGEQFWFQIVCWPVLPEDEGDNNWVAQGEKIIKEKIGEPIKEKPKHLLTSSLMSILTAIFEGFWNFFFFGKTSETKESEKEKTKEELNLGYLKIPINEQEKIKGISNKIAKLGYRCSIRSLYVAKKDVFFRPRKEIGPAFLSLFATLNCNRFFYIAKNRTEISYPIIKKRRLYSRKRRMFKHYKMRFFMFVLIGFAPMSHGKINNLITRLIHPFYPKEVNFPNVFFNLNTEELASLFHFPSKIVAPTPVFPRIEHRKGEPPPDLPIIK